MLFTEPTFLFLFLPLLLGVYYVSGVRLKAVTTYATRSVGLKADTTYGNWLLVIASVIFYAKGGGAFTWLVLGSIAFNYSMAIALDRQRESHPARAKAILTFAVVVNLVVLAVFKYANFFVDNLNTMLDAAGSNRLSAPTILLPIGISFFTFHAISYVVDVYRRDAAAQKSPVHAALYLLLFPQLIAGPIIRYRDIATQLTDRASTLDDFAIGVRRFVIGLGKKVLIANAVALPADRIFAMPSEQLSFGHAWLGVVCYTLQIYFDFSGYSDMAIGLGRMFGFRFPENFRWPYIASSVQDFWRRWHISLSTWFRDYLYVPLGGSRLSPERTYVNLVIVFLLCGLWHGASWTFVVWGLYHGAFLVIERFVRTPAHVPAKVRAVLRHTYTLLVVIVGWVFFRADTLAGAWAFLKAMAGFGIAAPTAFSVWWYLTSELWIALLAGVIGSAPAVPAIVRWAATHARPKGRAYVPSLTVPSSTVPARTFGWVFEAAAVAALSIILIASVLQIAARSYSPFIYFRF